AAAGNYAGDIVFTFPGGSSKLHVTYSVTGPSFVAGTTTATIAGINGSDLPVVNVPLSMSDGTSLAWSASSPAAWLKLSAASGQTPATLVVSADPGGPKLASG